MSIVEHFDPLKNREFSFRMALIDLLMYAFGLKRTKEALQHDVIVAVAFATHAHLNLKLSQRINTFDAEYLELALKLGVRPERSETIVNFEAVTKYGVKAEGNAQGESWKSPLPASILLRM